MFLVFFPSLEHKLLPGFTDEFSESETGLGIYSKHSINIC